MKPRFNLCYGRRHRAADGYTDITWSIGSLSLPKEEIWGKSVCTQSTQSTLRAVDGAIFPASVSQYPVLAEPWLRTGKSSPLVTPEYRATVLCESFSVVVWCLALESAVAEYKDGLFLLIDTTSRTFSGRALRRSLPEAGNRCITELETLTNSVLELVR